MLRITVAVSLTVVHWSGSLAKVSCVGHHSGWRRGRRAVSLSCCSSRVCWQRCAWRTSAHPRACMASLRGLRGGCAEVRRELRCQHTLEEQQEKAHCQTTPAPPADPLIRWTLMWCPTHDTFAKEPDQCTTVNDTAIVIRSITPLLWKKTQQKQSFCWQCWRTVTFRPPRHEFLILGRRKKRTPRRSSQIQKRRQQDMIKHVFKSVFFFKKKNMANGQKMQILKFASRCTALCISMYLSTSFAQKKLTLHFLGHVVWTHLAWIAHIDVVKRRFNMMSAGISERDWRCGPGR